MNKIFVNGLAVKPEDFAKYQNDPNIYLVSVAPLKYQTYSKLEVERHPNLLSHLQDRGIVPKPVKEIPLIQPTPQTLADAATSAFDETETT